MQRIYEEEIDINVENVDEYESENINLLKSENIPFKKKIGIKLEDGYDIETVKKFLLVYVDSENVEKVKDIIGAEFCTNLRDFSAEEIYELSCFELDEKIEDNNQEVEIGKYEQLYYEAKDDFNKIKKMKKKALIAYAVVGIILLLLFIGYGIFVAFQEINGNTGITMDSLELFAPFIVITIIVSLFYAGISYKYSKKSTKATNQIIVPISKVLLRPYNFFNEGLSENFLNSMYIAEMYDRCYFNSKNKLLGDIDNRKFVMSNLQILQEEASAEVFNGIFIKSQIKESLNRNVCLKISTYDINDNSEENQNCVMVYEDQYEIDTEILNDEFKNKLEELNDKYGADVDFYFVGNVVYIMIDAMSLLLSTEELFSNDFNSALFLKNFKIAEEYMEAVSNFKMIY